MVKTHSANGVAELQQAELVKLSLTEKDRTWVTKRWPHKTNNVDEVNVINLVQFLLPPERIHFVNELWRVLKPGAKAQISSPHWASARAHSDLAFVYPPVAEGW